MKEVENPFHVLEPNIGVAGLTANSEVFCRVVLTLRIQGHPVLVPLRTSPLPAFAMEEGNGFVHFAVSHFGGSPLASELLMSLALVACGIGRRQHRRDEKQDYGLRAPHTGVKQPGQFRTASVPFTFCVSGCSN